MENLRTKTDELISKVQRRQRKRKRRPTKKGIEARHGTARRRRPRRGCATEQRKRTARLPYVCHGREHRNAKRQWLKNRRKGQQLLVDLHCRTAHFMALHADAIVMPRMEVRGCVSRAGFLAKVTKRALLGWGHSTFLNRLALKCHDVDFDPRFPAKGSTVLLVQPEGYTSQTCGICGMLKKNLGGSKVFQCVQCGHRADRDHNGARNVLIKAVRAPADHSDSSSFAAGPPYWARHFACGDLLIRWVLLPYSEPSSFRISISPMNPEALSSVPRHVQQRLRKATARAQPWP